MPKFEVQYSSNNSGGYFWVDAEYGKLMENAGWDVDYIQKDSTLYDEGEQVYHARKIFEAIAEDVAIATAIAEFEYITGQDASAEGCPCCGPPHSFYTYLHREIPPELEGYDWEEAFAYTDNASGALPGASYDLDGFQREDVAEVYGTREGENDVAEWLVYGRLHDGRYFYLTAGCDYTGWDCQAGGSTTIARSYDELINFGLDNEAREVFGHKKSLKDQVYDYIAQYPTAWISVNVLVERTESTGTRVEYVLEQLVREGKLQYKTIGGGGYDGSITEYRKA